MLLGSDSSSPWKGTSTILTCCVMLYAGNFVEWNHSHRRRKCLECKISSVIFPAWEDLPAHWIVSLTPTSRAGWRWTWLDFTSGHSLLIRPEFDLTCQMVCFTGPSGRVTLEAVCKRAGVFKKYSAGDCLNLLFTTVHHMRTSTNQIDSGARWQIKLLPSQSREEWEHLFHWDNPNPNLRTISCMPTTLWLKLGEDCVYS